MKPYIRNMAQKLALLSLAFWLTLLLVLPAGTAAAETEAGIEIQSSAGYQGEMKEGRWFPAYFTLTNRTGRELSGELVVSVQSNWNGQKMDYSVKADLPIDTPISLSLAIPSSQLGERNNLVRFFEGSAENGKTVKLLGNHFLSGTISQSNMIGIVARDPDTLNFMPTLNQKGYSIKTVNVDPGKLPYDSLQLDTLDALLLNDISGASLSEAQGDAITQWVKEGGMLILSGGAGYEKTASPFQSIAPVAVQGTTTLNIGDELTPYIGSKKLPLNEPLTVSAATLAEGEVLLEEKGVILAAKRSLGLGEVLYVAFDPALEPMSSWGGSAALWAKLMGSQLQSFQPGGMIHSNMGYGPYWDFQNAVNKFPSIKSPHFMTLLYLFLIYIFVAAPLLFLLLKRLDRREWAWWIIPSIAIICSVAVFFVGASDKSKTLAHTVRVVALSGAGDGVQFGASSVFVPTGGDVRVTFNTPQALMPYQSDNGFGGGISQLEDDSLQVATRKDQETDIRWNDVSYWSTRGTYMDNAAVADTGQLETAFEESDKGTVLLVTNKLRTDLTDVHLIWNGQVVKIGELAIGQSGRALIPASAAGNPQSYLDFGGMIFPYPNSTQDDRQRERILTNAYSSTLLNAGQSNGRNELTVVGYSKDTEPALQVNGANVKSDRVTLWAQKVALDIVQGNKVRIPTGMLVPSMESTTMKGMESRPDGRVVVAQGEVVISYLLPSIDKVQYDLLQVQQPLLNANLAGMTLSIWNEKQGKWLAMTGNAMSWELKAPQQFITKDRTVRMKIDVLDENQYETMFPQIGLEGKVTH
ncbi:hypothetical protein K0T92_00445 [Paenibacillus oenotherae]|uniref:Glutamine amidotransferase domain-containing protein n=1 Tax=Paenibacillus oenotherae TaxID=1435645 RepID=A0ABS7D042_9BACL|nr:hypothetical protein [Paenibacillus oenotherae]MBW7473205.1 hypothetical protein [Paenibacillus oenotherae]